MADVSEAIVVDPDSLVADSATVVEGATVTEGAQESSDIVSKAFTSVEQDHGDVQYVTMTPEEAAAAGVMEEEQVVTTSLQFDPANPSVLYTSDGTLINQSDLSPEEQALVQAALQQHLAEQEAEQQLALIEQQSGAQATDTTVATSTTVEGAIEPIATITSAGDVEEIPVTSVNLASPHTNASQIVQTLADNVRRQQEYAKAQHLLNQATKQDLPEGFRYEEKIVIRQGQPQVVKMPVKTNPTPKKPEIPAALANLMPKIEVGKDGSQVIRIHQSQITADQLKSLQENPNVRLVFRPASSRSQTRSSVPGMPNSVPQRKRGRPRKNFSPVVTHQDYSQKDEDDSPPAKTRYGRMTKQPFYSKDYMSPENNGDEIEDRGYEALPKAVHVPVRKGRPPGSLNKSTLDKSYRRSNSYASKIEALREQEEHQTDEISSARLSITPQKPVLTSVEQAISTRRKNRLRELLSVCSEDEIMEVALPHLARVFSLWEFLVMKVEKNKLSRVYFADVYKEYEALHKYVCRLTEKYKEKLIAVKADGNKTGAEIRDAEETLAEEKKNVITVRCKKLAVSLGLDQEELEDAMIPLLDTEPIKVAQEVVAAGEFSSDALQTQATDSKINVSQADDSSKPVQTEATSTNSPLVVAEDGGVTTEQSAMPPLAPLAASAANNDQVEVPVESMEVDQNVSAQVTAEQEAAQTVTEAGNTIIAPSSTSSQIIQIGTGDDKQFIEVPEGYTLIQTPEGLVMSQPGTTLSQAEDGTIYVTQEDGTTSPLDSQKTGVPLETVESLLSLEGQQQQQ